MGIPNDACTFVDHCTPSDMETWQRTANAWITAADGLTKGHPPRERLVTRLKTRWQQLSNDGASCTALDCHYFVEGFVAITGQARAAMSSWTGVAEDQIENPEREWWELNTGGDKEGGRECSWWDLPCHWENLSWQQIAWALGLTVAVVVALSMSDGKSPKRRAR